MHSLIWFWTTGIHDPAWVQAIAAAAVVVLSFVTLAVLVVYAYDTHTLAKTSKVSAEAALLNAKAVMDSERAWMIAEMNPLSKSMTGSSTFKIAPRMRNKGKTPAFIVESATSAVVLPKGNSLPKTPNAYPSVAKWDGRGVPLAPEGEIGGDFFGEFHDEQGVLKGDWVLWVYGYVKYHDAFLREIRETHYCFRWEPLMNDYKGSQFSIDGLDGYNKAT